MNIEIIKRHLKDFVSQKEFEDILPEVAAAADCLDSKNGPGSDFLGWDELPNNYDRDEVERIKAAAQKIKSDSAVLVVIGIGGSYLGARSAIELIKSPFYNALPKDTPEIYFAGCNISASYIKDIINIIGERDFSVNVISKSGTTTEPALAFRIFRKLLIKKYGEAGAAKRIYCTTDKQRGTLKEQANSKGYESFVVPDDIGGRYSVLTAVGLLPIAVCGADIDAILAGAAQAKKELAGTDAAVNPCLEYVAYRNLLYRKGYTTEIFVSYEPAFAQMNEWLKQLFGESEGKDKKGIFPASVIFSTDLHSLGQYIQDGRRELFETVVDFEIPKDEMRIYGDDSGDGLDFLSGKDMSTVVRNAMQGTAIAHSEGGTPNIIIKLPKADEFGYGYLVYFFEKACAVSGYLLGVNPFDQPGVESYKKNMFALLGKPGYEELAEKLKSKL